MAIDIDGTLLDSRSVLRPAVRQALRRAVEAGVQILLSTGRRYRTALEIAREAELPLPIICHGGALVKDTGTHRTLFVRPFPPADLELLLDALAEFRLTPLVYTDTFETGRDFFIQRGAALTPYHEDYLAKNAGWYGVIDSMPAEVPDAVIQVCTFDELERLRGVRPRIEERLAGRATCHLLHSAKYVGHFLEFLAGSASKWAAVSSVDTSR